MRCPNCGFDNPPDMIFCGMCGTQLAQSCPSCGKLMPLGFRFCGQCGAQLPGGAPEMPALQPSLSEVPEDEITVSEPPSPTAPQGARPASPIPPAATPLAGERRQATILIADVKESTNLMEQIGTEAWVEIMNDVLKIMAAEVNRFGGEVDQFRGDGLVAFFGARSAHEDDPERAVLSALTMQHAIKRFSEELAERTGIDLSIRVGVNTGEVIAASIGDRSQYSEETAMGEAIALAARIETIAEPGTVLVSENTYRLAESQFKWQALGEISIKGVHTPIAVYRPLAPLSEAEQQHRLQEYGFSIPMIGREAELQSIKTAIKNLCEGIGGIVLVSGEAGMGKSRLTSEVQQSIAREAAVLCNQNSALTWLQGRCRSYGRSLPHSMWIDVLRRWLGTQEWESQEKELEQLRIKTQDLWGDQFEEYYPYLAKFLSLPLEESFSEWVEHLEAEGLRHQFFLVIQSWVAALAKRGPLVMVFTEAHWVDEASLALLKHCLPLCDQMGVLWIIVFRPDPSAPTWEFKHYISTAYPHRLLSLELSALTIRECNQLLDQAIGPDVFSENMRDTIIQKAEGNPYYLTELIHSLVEKGTLVRDESTGRWKVTQDEVSLTLPDTLKSLLIARITNLSAEEQRILQLAAVIGTVFWSDLLQVLVGQDSPIKEHLTSLQRAGLIRERGQLPGLGREYVFTSALIRDAAYESLLSAQQSSYHLMVAEFLESLVSERVLPQYHGIVAYHYRHANIIQKELFHTLLAAEKARQIYANAEAVKSYTRALEILDGLEEDKLPPSDRMVKEWRLEALRGLGQICFGVGKVLEAETHLRAAIELGKEIGLEPRPLARLYYWLGEVLIWQSDYEEPIHLGEEGLSILGQDTESVEAALMNQLTAVGYLQQGDYRKFLEFTYRTAAFIQSLPYSEELRPAYDHIIGAYINDQKDVARATQWLEAFEYRAAQYHDLRALGEVSDLTASILVREGDLQGAIRHHKEALELFQRIGDAKHESRAWKNMGTTHLLLGNIQVAEKCFSHAVEIAESFGNKSEIAIGYWHKAMALLCQGLWEEAILNLQKTGHLIRDVKLWREDWSAYGLGRVYLSQGNRAEALRQFKKVAEMGAVLFSENLSYFISLLSGLEEAYEDHNEFQAYCRASQNEYPGARQSAFVQWFLMSVNIGEITEAARLQDDLTDPLSSGWVWKDPFEDCSYMLREGLEIHAANGRNIEDLNLSAPRMLRPLFAEGDFTIQTVCSSVSEEKPSIGGILLWKDRENWLCLERGIRGPQEISFRGCLGNTGLAFGRGRLPPGEQDQPLEGVILRLERSGQLVKAFCSLDGETWFTVGHVEFPVGGSLEVGLHAIGYIDRLIYPGAYPDGTAIRFKSFQLWGE